jgi:hypothetical protein
MLVSLLTVGLAALTSQAGHAELAALSTSGRRLVLVHRRSGRGDPSHPPATRWLGERAAGLLERCIRR